MSKKNLIILLSTLGVVITALIIGLILTLNKSSEQSEQIAATETFMEQDKQQMQNEVQQMAGEMEGYTVYVHNDSLLREFDSQKQKIKDLQSELKKTKATDAKRITELKAEIATLRKILAHFVQQIDSLNTQNKRLTNENLEVKQKYASVSATAEQLEKDKESLNEVVTRASILEVYNFGAIMLDRKNKRTDRASKITNIQLNFTIGKNITAKPGMKTMYVRLTRPDEELMTTGASGNFQYENKQIPYSISKEIEYNGDAQDIVMYWKVEEILQIGTYRADFFADGNRIGSFNFRIEKK